MHFVIVDAAGSARRELSRWALLLRIKTVVPTAPPQFFQLSRPRLAHPGSANMERR